MKLNTITIGFVVAAIVFFGITYWLEGGSKAINGVRSGLSTFISVLPLIIAAMIIAGLIEVLIPKEMIANILGSEAGIKGILIGGFAGAVMPGPPYVSFPIAASLFHSGAGIGAVVAFITAWALWQITRIPLEIAFISSKFVLIRILSTLIFPILAGILAQYIAQFIS
ncbi:MAG TPA: permease [Methanosarcinales archaeon]|nr:permease [Methanosarcinales archaeon]